MDLVDLALVNAVMNLRIPSNAGNILTVGSSEWTLLHVVGYLCEFPICKAVLYYACCYMQVLYLVSHYSRAQFYV